MTRNATFTCPLSINSRRSYKTLHYYNISCPRESNFPVNLDKKCCSSPPFFADVMLCTGCVADFRVTSSNIRVMAAFVRGASPFARVLIVFVRGVSCFVRVPSRKMSCFVRGAPRQIARTASQIVPADAKIGAETPACGKDKEMSCFVRGFPLRRMTCACSTSSASERQPHPSAALFCVRIPWGLTAAKTQYFVVACPAPAPRCCAPPSDRSSRVSLFLRGDLPRVSYFVRGGCRRSGKTSGQTDEKMSKILYFTRKFPFCAVSGSAVPGAADGSYFP